MIKINQQLLDRQTENARKSERNRTIHTFHSQDDDILQRMLNTGNPETYCQPHKHENPDKREVFILLTGKCVVVEFNDDGTISENIILDGKNNFAVEIAPGRFHHFIILEEHTTLYELKDGPYNPKNDKIFADWAPNEEAPEAKQFNETMKQKLNL